MSDYLFDKQGPVNPEVAELELALRPLAYRHRPLPLPSRGRPRALWIATAGLAVAAALVAIVLWRPPPGGREWLETGAGRMRLQIGNIGTVDLEPNTRARMVESGAQHRLEMEYGTLVAKISAPARVFAIQTPRTLVTDLGCAFTVTVDASGVGRVIVTEGKVGLSAGGSEVVVPAGSECALTAQGFGVPSPSQPATPAQNSPQEPVKVAPEKTIKAAPEKPARGSRDKPTKNPSGKAGKAAHKGAPPHAPAAPASTPAASGKTAPQKPGHRNEPAKGPDPGLKLNHDAFRDIDRTVPR